jgi:hypothetical protein
MRRGFMRVHSIACKFTVIASGMHANYIIEGHYFLFWPTNVHIFLQKVLKIKRDSNKNL